MYKRFIAIFLIVISVGFIQIAVLAHDYSVSKAKKSLIFIQADVKAANVSQIKGISIFIMCTPANEYEFIGTVKKSFAWSGSNDEMINGLVEKAKKQYPTCQGIVFNTLDFEKCEAIKFK